MTRPSARRPLPALIFLIALSLLSALVWWRVLHRSSPTHHVSATPTCTPTPAASITEVPAPAAVRVTVLNSTQRQGLAATVAQSLTALGFTINGPVANDPNPIAGVADIRYGPAGQAAATLLHLYVPGATLQLNQSSDASVVLSLGAQFSALAAPTAVAAALSSAHLVQLPPPPTTAASGASSPATASGSVAGSSGSAAGTGSASASPSKSC